VLLAVLVTVHEFTALRHPLPRLAGMGLLVATLSLSWRRRTPLTVLALTAAVCLSYEAAGYEAIRALPFAVLIMVATVSARLSPTVSGSAAAALAVGAVTAAVTQPGELDDDELIDQLIALAAAWMAGIGVRLNRVRTALLEEKAVQLVREQAVHTRLAVELERARIARELHDIVAHHVSVIVAQAGSTRRVLDRHPELAATALGSIEAVGREALTELRRLLSVLRTDHHGRDHAPQPGLGEMPALVAQIERAQLPVELAILGRPRRLPPGVELNAYRIVQESLTNTLKHAGPTRARVVMDYGADTLELRISDEGRGAPASPSTGGHGLVGMRERVALLGGKLTAGPGPRGGFQVTAVLPVEGGA
jgi:signal transduction histidine kinase